MAYWYEQPETVTPIIKFAVTHLYTWVKRSKHSGLSWVEWFRSVLLRNTQCPLSLGLKPDCSIWKYGTLTQTPQHLPLTCTCDDIICDHCEVILVTFFVDRGTEEYLNCKGRVDIINSTLGKALGGGAGMSKWVNSNLISWVVCEYCTFRDNNNH